MNKKRMTGVASKPKMHGAIAGSKNPKYHGVLAKGKSGGGSKKKGGY